MKMPSAAIWMAGSSDKERVGLAGLPRPWLHTLIADHLRRQDRLRLFRVSKPLAATVVEHSPHIKLCLRVDKQNARAPRQQAARQAVRQHAMKELLAPLHRDANLHVTLVDRVSDKWEEVPITWAALPLHQVTYLVLYGLHITIHTLRKLQLQRCIRLHTLETDGGTSCYLPKQLEPGPIASKHSPGKPKQLVRGTAANMHSTVLPKLPVCGTAASKHGAASSKTALPKLPVLGTAATNNTTVLPKLPAIRTAATRHSAVLPRQPVDGAAALKYTPSLPLQPSYQQSVLTEMKAYFPQSLTELRLEQKEKDATSDGDNRLGRVLGHRITSILACQPPPRSFKRVTHYHDISGEVLDEDLAKLLTTPSLTHITVHVPEIRRDMRDQDFKWQQLLFKSGADLSTLVLLPVWSIQNLVIRHQLVGSKSDESDSDSDYSSFFSDSDDVDSTRAEVDLEEAAAHLSRCPNLQCMPRYYRGLGMSLFMLFDNLSPSIISMCAHSFCEPTSLWFQQYIDPATSIIPESLALLSTATNVTSLGFVWLERDWFKQRSPVQGLARFWERVVAAMPKHITEVILGSLAEKFSGHALSLVPALVASPRHQHICVKVLLFDTKRIPRKLQQLMDSYPNRVHVKFVSVFTFDVPVNPDEQLATASTLNACSTVMHAGSAYPWSRCFRFDFDF